MVDVQCGDRIYRNITAILFDKDGTLSDSHEYLRQVALKRSRILEHQIADRAPANFTEKLFQAWGFRDRQVHPASMLAMGSRRDNEIVTAGFVAALGYDWIEALSITEAAFAKAQAAFPSKQEITTIFPGVLPMVQRLHQTGLKLCILSADVLPNIAGFAQHYQLDSYFDFYQGAEPGLSKPNPQLLDMACAGLGVKPEQTLMIGDSRADIELGRRGKAAGVIGVSWGWHSPFNIPNADIMLRSIDEIQVVGA
ncbi:HAD family hydrolase [filamentous cyanobacterium LEGE 11480]|uniref:HAD family hydrolase n=1 Tax=Romeriopsis navalis LEGE 11480 TaxID=2777977 RepID=A0A928Z664_9CYAN|nr:HAD family hydrolase [Romeriopsis navalis]MBE9032717.1 HAD family hydrolase [Romeriopsis navalis LEGE 11480]